MHHWRLAIDLSQRHNCCEWGYPPKRLPFSTPCQSAHRHRGTFPWCVAVLSMHTSRTFYLPMDAFRLLTRSDPDFSGYIVIDWEEWQPYMNPRSQSVYMQASLTYAGGNINAAVMQWNASALDWMVQTLRTARALRPHAKIGYYGIVGCYGQWDVAAGTCGQEELSRNDALAPLWAASSALFPSIYSACQYAGAPYPRCLPDLHNATEAEKIPITLREAMRVNTLHVPVVAFTWY